VVKGLKAGPKTSFLLTTTNNVLAFGLNRDSQLSLPKGDIYTPTLLDLPSTVAEVHAGFKHTIFVTSTNEFLGFGSNKNGQLSDMRPPFPSPKVRVSWHNTVWFTKSELEVWGDNKFGQRIKYQHSEIQEIYP
jgi:alpha-tubulin suppressor-like RCC1 family protein